MIEIYHALMRIKSEMGNDCVVSFQIDPTVDGITVQIDWLMKDWHIRRRYTYEMISQSHTSVIDLFIEEAKCLFKTREKSLDKI